MSDEWTDKYMMMYDGPRIEDHIEVFRGWHGDLAIMERREIVTVYDDHDGPWAELDDDAKEWWLDYLCRRHACDVALARYPDDVTAAVAQEAALGNDMEARLEITEDALDRLPAWETYY